MEENIDQSIPWYKSNPSKFTSDKGLNKDEFVSRLQHVILYKIEVPEHTDLKPLLRDNEHPWRAIGTA